MDVNTETIWVRPAGVATRRLRSASRERPAEAELERRQRRKSEVVAMSEIRSVLLRRNQNATAVACGTWRPQAYVWPVLLVPPVEIQSGNLALIEAVLSL